MLVLMPACRPAYNELSFPPIRRLFPVFAGIDSVWLKRLRMQNDPWFYSSAGGEKFSCKLLAVDGMRCTDIGFEGVFYAMDKIID